MGIRVERDPAGSMTTQFLRDLMSVLFALNNEVADSHVGFPFVAGTDRVVSVVHKLASGKSVNGLLFYSSAFELVGPASCRWIMAILVPIT